MSRVHGAITLAILLAACAKPDAEPIDAYNHYIDVNDPSIDDGVSNCTPPPPTSPAWEEQASTPREHIVDGQFGEGEWDDILPLEGQYTDLYLDFQDGYLYALNDWRINQEGIRPDCFNEFRLTIGSLPVTIKVYGDGEITVEGAMIEGKGAFSVSPSLRWSTPHTIWEFKLALETDEPISVCCLDPVTLSSCEELIKEPVVFAIHILAGTIRIARLPPPEVPELAIGAPCGDGQGICGPGLSCIYFAERASCYEATTPLPDDDLTDATTTDAVSDITEDPTEDTADRELPGEDAPW